MWIVKLGLWLLGLIVPALKPPDPAVKAQAEKDRADSAEALLKAKVQGDGIQDKLASDFAADPGKLRQPDKFELK